MDIGGFDLIIDTTLTREEQRRCALVYLRNLWPEGILEEDDLEPGDFFFYRNVESKDFWDKGGRIDQNAHDMVYVLCRKAYITFVHEGLDEAGVIRFVGGIEKAAILESLE